MAREKSSKTSNGPFVFLIVLILLSRSVFAFDLAPGNLRTDLSGYAKSLNILSRTTGLNPELIDRPFERSERGENLFQSAERARLQTRFHVSLREKERVTLKIDYDHQPTFGSFVGSGDFRLAKRIREEHQWVDLSQTLIEEDGSFYEHQLYRASLIYESEHFAVEVGREQVPWGLGHFFTPTDLFNPFTPTQLELDERAGVDAANLTVHDIAGFKTQFVYTPRGRSLHPQRFLTKVSHDVAGYETSLFAGFVQRDFVSGFDFQGNVRDSVLRGEFLFREAEEEKDFIQFMINADYNFPHNVYGLLEYSFNGQGRRDPDDYQTDRLIKGELRDLGRNYLAAMLGYDITPLWRFEHRTIMNLHDASFFVRPELQYEMRSNLLLTFGAQLFLGDKKDEYRQAQNLWFGEIKYSF